MYLKDVMSFFYTLKQKMVHILQNLMWFLEKQIGNSVYRHRSLKSELLRLLNIFCSVVFTFVKEQTTELSSLQYKEDEEDYIQLMGSWSGNGTNR